MDRSLTLTHYTYNPSHKPSETFAADTFRYEPARAPERGRRGLLTCLVETELLQPKEINLTKLHTELFKQIQETYYHQEAPGSPLEALEQAIEKAQQRKNELTDQTVKTQIYAGSVWGDALTYANLYQQFVGIRRNHEFFELDQISFGTEQLKDQDLILTASSDLAKRLVKPYLREQQTPDNPEFLEKLKEKLVDLKPNTLEGAASLLALQVSITSIPGEEEVIELHYPDQERKNPTRKKIKKLLDRLPPLSLPSVRFLPKLPFFTEPSVYLKKNLNSKRGRKLLVVLLILALLGVSLLGSYFYKRQKEQTVKLSQVLQQASTQLQQAKELTELDPQESLKLTNQSHQQLQKVKGIQDNPPKEVEKLLAQIQQIKESIFKTKTVKPERKTPPVELKNQPLQLTDGGLYTTNKKLLVKTNSQWKSPNQAATYYDNLYLLDPPAQAIWKYAGSNQGYLAPTNYLKDSPQISGARDLAIDGAIYLLFSNRVSKFFLGEPADFKPRGVYPSLEQSFAISTHENSDYIYIALSGQKILVFNKQGEYQKLLEFEQPRQVEDIFVTGQDGSLWLYSPNGWWQVSPVPE